MKRIQAALTIIVLSAVFLFSGCSLLQQAQTEPEEQETPPVAVTVAEAYRGTLEVRGVFSGVLEPDTTVSVVHKTGGKVSEKLVKDGDRIQEGALMLTLDSAELSAQISQAEASLRVIELQIEAAADSLEDTRLLYEEDIVSRQQLDQAETQYKILEAQAAQIEASMELLFTNLDNTRITAPISGTINGLTVNAGEMISPGMPVATINKLDPMVVRVQLTEKDVGRVELWQIVDVFVSAVYDEALEGTVETISPIADARTKTYAMKVSLPNAGGRLLAGMTASLELVMSEEKDTVIIPSDAVLTQQGRQYVYILEDDSPKRCPVTTGLINDNYTSILEGIKAGDLVIVSGQHYIEEGSRVTVVGGVN